MACAIGDNRFLQAEDQWKATLVTIKGVPPSGAARRLNSCRASR
jgi:hypothetical protein